MSDMQPGVEARRTLLEKYLRGEIPQVRKMTNVVAHRTMAETSDQRTRVVAIHLGGSKRPFFFLHGDFLSGASWCFSLAHQLGADQPFYALEPFNFDGLPVPPPFEAIAAEHLESLRAVQPEGPYLLGGFCNGGLLAYEMARQLHVQGQKVDLLVLMDPVGLVYPARQRLASGVVSRIGELLRLDRDKQLNGYILLRHLYSYLLSPVYRRLEGYERFRWRGDQEGEPGRKQNKVHLGLPRFQALFPSVEALRQNYAAVYDWMAMRYTPPGLYPGKITFFWDSEEPWRRTGWRRAAETNELEVHFLPGKQMPMRTSYLHVLAEHLKACLSEVQAGA